MTYYVITQDSDESHPEVLQFNSLQERTDFINEVMGYTETDITVSLLTFNRESFDQHEAKTLKAANVKAFLRKKD